MRKMSEKNMSQGTQREENPEIKKKDAIVNILENYESLEKSIVAQLNFGYKGQGVVTGSNREIIWKSMFEQMIPKKFSIEQGVFIIDSKEGISREVDLAIFDETYTPYIFRYGHLKFIPIEAVAAVIECKSTTLDDTSLKKWSDSIDKLKTGIGSITRLNSHVDVSKEVIFEKDKNGQDVIKTQTQTSTRPIKILCHMKNMGEFKESFDLTIEASGEKLKIYENNNFKELSDIYETLNHHKTENKEIIRKAEGLPNLSEYEVKQNEEEVSLLSLMFKLNQLLMIINNPMFFPHRAYVEMFKDEFQELLKQKVEKEKGGNK